MKLLLGLYKAAIITLVVFSTNVFAQFGINSETIIEPSRYHPVKQGEYWLIEGDIIVAKDSPGFGVAIPPFQTARWPNAKVPYEIADTLPADNRERVLAAMDHWMLHSNVTFVPRTDEKAYVRFIPSEGTICSSAVGRTGGQQVINLAPRCNRGSTIHEIGHALGLWHEQSRADRDSYLRIYFDRIKPDKLHNFDKHVDDGVDLGEYDYHSIMHYGPYAFSATGEITLEPIQAKVKIGQRDGLSAGDIGAIQLMYPEDASILFFIQPAAVL